MKEIYLYRVALSGDARYIVSSGHGKDNFGLSLWHIDGRLLDFIEQNSRHAYRPAFGMAKTENRLLSYIPPDSLQFWRIERDQLVRTTGYKLPEDDRKCQEIAMSKDGDIAFVVFGDEVELWSEEQGKIRSLLQPYERVTSITVSPDGRLVGVACGTKSKGFCTYTIDGNPGLEINRMPLSYSGPGRYHGNLIAIDPQSKRIARSVKNRVFIYDLRGRLVGEFQVGDDEDENRISALTFSHDGRRLIVAQYYTYMLSVYSDHGDLIKTIRGGDKWGLRCLTLHPDGRHVITGGNDGTVRIWDIETGEQVIFRNEANEWVNYTPDGYFDSSKKGGRQVAMVRNITPFAIDQFAMTNNRPDIILKRMKLASKDKINHFYLQYQKRIHRAGFTEGQLKQDYHVPTTTLITANQRGKQMQLNFQVRDDRYDLKSYNVYVNDVPLFGAYGKEVSGHSARMTENIELSAGANKIEISCFNVAGAESYRAITNARYDKKVTPDLYFLGFGISRYKNPELNLGYAHKDALDLAAAVQGLSNKPGNVYVKTFTNEQVTIRNIKNAKQFLKPAKVDDIFVLFIAGHGVHERSDEATYYYLTHNAELDNLANTAADFEMIEQLLHGINPRKKLFLMDTCESGELDNATQQAYYALANSRGIKARTSRAVILRKRSESPERSYLYQKDRYIYNDLIRRSGAIVFSSSKGGEFSYESDAVQNGFFTEEILNCLTQGAGDENGDGVVSTTELRTYVTTAVAQATDDAQHPTVDRDNIYQKFGFPVK
ncbi:hypothetical protein GF337_18290 [candidate division KSB1 bacterium]|nr:hypothetical protein [candidate division KSB1 bacterium]